MEVEIGGDVIRCTPNHPFYVRGRGFIPAEQLKSGDELRSSAGGWASIGSIGARGDVEPVYNIRVAGLHTYFVRVGVSDVLVHNKGGGPDGDATSGQHDGGVQAAPFLASPLRTGEIVTFGDDGVIAPQGGTNTRFYGANGVGKAIPYTGTSFAPRRSLRRRSRQAPCSSLPIRRVSANQSATWTEDGVIRAFIKKYGNDEKAMKGLVAVLSVYTLKPGPSWWDAWWVNHKTRTIYIANDSGYFWAKSNEDAADQLYRVLADEFYRLTDLPETWHHFGGRVGRGTGKTVGVGFSAFGSALLAATPDLSGLTKVGGYMGLVFSANTFVDGVTEFGRRDGGVNVLGEMAGAYGRWMNGKEGEASAALLAGI